MEFVERYRWGGDKLNKEEYEQYEKPLDLMVTLTVLLWKLGSEFLQDCQHHAKDTRMWCGIVYPFLGVAS